MKDSPKYRRVHLGVLLSKFGRFAPPRVEGRGDGRSGRQVSGIALSLTAALVASCALFSGYSAQAADTAVNVLTTGTDLSLSATYLGGALPGATNDVTFTNNNYSGGAGTIFNANGASLTYGTLDTNSAQSITITNTNGTASSITLSSVANATSGSQAADLLFVASGAALTIQNGTGTLTLNLTNTGNIDDIGTLTLSGPISITAGKTISFTGNGITTVSGAIAGATGAVAINDGSGTVTLSGNNTFGSGLTLTAGTLIATSNANALGGGALSLGGGTLYLTNASGTSLAFNNNTTVTASTQITTDVTAASHAGNTYTLGTLSIGAQTLTIAGGVNVNSGTAGVTFGAVSTTGNSTFTVNNPVNGGVTLLTIPSITPSGTDTLTFNGSGNTIVTGLIGATASTLTYAGSGTLTLSGNNTFTGGVTLTSGTLVAETSAGALGAGASATALSLGGGTLYLTNASGTNLAFNRNTTVTASSLITSDVTVASNAGNTYTLGTLAIGAQTLTIQGGPAVNSGTAGVTLGAVTSSAASTFTVNNPANGGVTLLTLASIAPTLGTTLTFNGNGNTTVTGAISGANTAAVTKSGAGTLLFTGANTYTGATTVNAGTLQLSGAAGANTGATAYTLTGGSLILNDLTAAGGNLNNRIASGSTINFNGGNLNFEGANLAATNSTESVGAVTSGVGSSTITISFGGTNVAALTAASFIHTAGNATVLVNGVNLGENSTATASVARFISTAAPTGGALVGTTAALSTGINSGVDNTTIVPFLVGEATSTTGGLGTATGTANTFVTYIAGVGFRPLNPTDEFKNNAIVATDNTYITANTASPANTSINSLIIAGGNLTINDGFTLTNTSGALLFTTGNAIMPSTSTGILSFGATEAEVTVNASVTGTISAPITATTTGGLTKSGLGTLVITAADAYTGVTKIDAGTLQLGNGGSLAPASTITDNGNLTFNESANLVQGTAFSTAAITGTGSLTQAGSGSLTLNAANTFTGGVNLNNASGTVIATVAGGLGATSGQVTFNAAGTLDLRGATVTYTSGINTVPSGGTITVEPASSGAGVTQTLSLANTLGSHTLVLSPGSLTTNNSNYGLTLSGANTFSAASTNATFTINGNGSGNGTLTLSGGFNTAGNTDTLTFNTGSGTGVDSAVISGAFTGAAGTLILAGNAPVAIGSLTTTANALEVSGSGAYTFNGTSTFTGGVLLNNANATVIATTAGGLGATSGQVKFNVAGSTLDLRGAAVTYTSGINSSLNGGTITVEPAVTGPGVTDTMSLANTFGSNTIVLSPGALTTANSPYGLTLTGALTFSAANSNAVFTINGNGTGNGTLTLSPGTTNDINTGGNTETLTFNAGTGTGFNSAVITASAFTGLTGTLILAGSAPVTIGALTATGNAVTINSSTGGVYTFNAANTYTGLTTVSGGTLIETKNSTAIAGGVTVSGGAFDYEISSNATLTLPTLTLTGGAGTAIGDSIGSTVAGAEIIVTNAVNATGAVKVNLFAIPGITTGAAGTYTLVTGNASSTLNGATYTLGTVYNDTNFIAGTPVALPSGTILQVGITPDAVLTTAYWTGGLTGGTNVWAASNGSTASNWVATSGGAAQPLVPGAAAAVTISNSAVTTAPTATILGANMTINSLTIADTTNGLGLNADGNTLTITPTSSSTGITMNASVPASFINANVALGANQTWTNNSGNALTVLGNVSGAFSLTKAGTGNLILAGANTFSSGLTLSAGTLTATVNAGALGASGGVTLGGGILYLTNPSGSVLTFTNGNTTVTGNTQITSDVTVASTAGNTYTLGTLAIGAQTLTIQGGSDVNSGTAGVAFGAVTSSSNTTFTVTNPGNGGVTLLTLASIAPTAGTTLTFNGNGKAAVTGVLGATNAAVTYAGTGTLALNGANTFTGGLTIQTGTVQLGNAGGAGAGLVTIGSVGNSATLDLNGQSGTIIQLATAGTATSQTIGNSSNSAGATLNYTGATTSTFGGLIENQLPGNTTQTVGLTVNNPSADLILTDANTYTGATLVSAGTLQLSGANGSDTGATAYTLTGGSLILDDLTAAGGNLNNRIASGSTIKVNGGNLNFEGADATTTNSTESVGAVTSGVGSSTITISFGGTNVAALTAASFVHTAGNATVLINGVNLGENSTATSSVARFFSTTTPNLVGTTAALSTGDNSGVDNTKIVPFLVGEATSTTGGLGTATGTANTFVTYIAGVGFRPLNPTDEFDNNAIATGNNTYITAGTTSGANTSINSLVIAGGNVTITDGFTLTNTSGALLFTTNNAIQPSSSTGALAFGATEAEVTANTSVSGTISAPITGSVGLTKSGLGTLVLTAADTSLTGAINIDAGTLQIGNGGSTGTLATGGTIVDNGNLTFNESANIVQGTAFSTTAISGAGSLTQAGSGSLTLNLTNTFTGGIALNNGSIIATLAGALGPVANTVTFGGGNLTLQSASAVTYTNLLNMVSSGGTITVNPSASGPGITETDGAITVGGGNTLIATGGSNVASGVAGLTLGAVTETGNFTFTSTNPTNGTTLLTLASITPTNGTTLTFNGNGSTTVTGVLGASSAAVTYAGTAAASTLTLSGANTFTGGLNIQNGTVKMGPTATSGVGAGLITIGASTNTAILDLNAQSEIIGQLASAGTAAADFIGNSGASAATLNFNNANTSSFGGTIENVLGAGSSTVAVTVNNAAGILNLSGANTYTGATTLTAGTINLSGTLNGSSVTVTPAAAVFSESSAGVIGGASAAFTVTNGTVTLAGNNTYGGLTSIAAGTLTLSGSNSGAGGVTLTAGTLNVNNANALGAVGGTLTITTGVLNNTSGAAITNAIANPIAIGANSFTFGTAASTGTNNLNLGTGAITNSGSRTITFAGTGTTLTLGGVMTNTSGGIQTTTVTSTLANVSNTLVLGGYNLGTFTDVFKLAQGLNVSITGPITNGGLTYTNSGTVTSSTMTLSGSSNYAGATTVNANGTMIISGTLGATPITLTLGNLQLQNAAGIGSATLALNAGALLLCNNTNTTFSDSSTTIGGNVTINVDNLGSNTGNTLTLGAIGIGANVLTVTNGDSYNLTTGTITASAGPTFTNSMTSGTFTIGALTSSPASTQTATFNGASTSAVTKVGVISQNSGNALAVTQSGSGLLQFTGANTYTGLTTVSSGTLQLGAGASILSGNNLTTAAAGTFDMNGNAETFTLLSDAGTVTNSGASTTLNIGNGSTGAGIVSGSMNVIWTQGATPSALTGPIGFINTGNITLNASNSAGTIGITTVNNTGTVTNAGTAGAVTLTNIGSNVTGVTENSAASALTISGFNSGFSGGVTVVSGTLGISSPEALGTGTLTLYPGTFFNQLNEVSGVGTLIGLGGVSLSGSVTYLGTTAGNTVLDLRFATTTLTGSTMLNVNAGQLTLGNILGGSNVLNLIGAGTVVLAGNASNTSGLITDSVTTLNLQKASGNAIGANGLTINNAATTTLMFGNQIDDTAVVTVNNGGTLNLTRGFSETIGGLAGGGTVNINAGQSLTVAATSGTYSFSGIFNIGGSSIGDSGNSLIKTGNSMLILSGSGTMNMVLQGGVLRATSNVDALGATVTYGGAGAGLLTLTSGTLQLANDTALNFAKNTLVNGNVQIASDTLTFGAAGVTQTLNTLSIGGQTLTIAAGGNVGSGTAGVTFGATTLNGNPTFTVNSGALLTLGALNDSGTPVTITVNGSGSGALTLASAATSLVNGTVIDVNGGTLNSNLAGALGTLATVDVEDGATFAVGATQTIGGLTNVNTVLNTGTVGIGSGFTLTVGSTTNNLSGSYSGIISGLGSLTKAGTGTLTLSNNSNSYSGVTTVNGGVLRATSAGALGASTLTLTSGSLQLANNSNTNFGRNTTVGGNTTITIDTLPGGSGAGVTDTLGTLSIGSNTLTLNNGVNVTSGTTGLIFGATTLTGNAVINIGIGNLTLGAVAGSTNTLKLQGTGNFAETAPFGAAATLLTLDTSYSGVATLNQNNLYTGATSVNGGTLLLDFSGMGTPTNAIAPTSTLTLGDGTLSLKGKTSAVTAQTFGNVTLGANTGSTVVLNPNTATSLTLTLGSTWTRNAGSTLNINLSAGGTVTSAPVVTGAQSTTSNILGYATVQDATSTGFATVVGGNMVRYTGAAALAASSNSATTNYAYNASGLLTMATASRSLNSLSIDTTAGANTLDLGGAADVLTLTQKGLLMTGVNNATIQNGQVGAAATEVIVHQMGSGILSINGTISSGAGSLTKDGSGTLVLGASNSYTGGTVISAGTVQAGTGNSYALGSVNGALTLNNAGTLDLNGNTIAIDALNSGDSGAGSGGVINNSAAGSATLTVGSNNSSSTFYGLIENTGGALSLIQNGTGTLTLQPLAGNNTFTGGVTLNLGTLDINASTALGSGTFTINGGAIDNMSSAALTLAGNNAQVWGGDFTFNGTQNLNLGTGVVSLGSGAGTARTVTVGAGILTEGGLISNGATVNSLIKAGAGTLVLTGSSTYTGETLVNGGILSVSTIGNSGAADPLGTSGTIGLGGNAGSSTLQYTGAGETTNRTIDLAATNAALAIDASGAGALSFTSNLSTSNVGYNFLTLTGANTGANTFSGNIADSGAGYTTAIAKSGGGTWVLSAASNTYSGGLTLNAGTLDINSASALGTGRFVNNGGSFDNTSGSPITLTGVSSQLWAGSVNFVGSNALTFGSGGVTLGGVSTTTITDNGANLTENGAINGANSLTQIGTGTLTLGGANNFGYNGATVAINGGTVNINNASAFGSSNNLVIFEPGAGVTIGNTSGSAINLSSYTFDIYGDLTFNGPSNLNLGAGSIDFAGSRTITVTTGTLTMGGYWSALGNGQVYNITKAGNGTLTLAAGMFNQATSTSSATFTLAAGTLNINSPSALGPTGNTGNAPLVIIDDSTTIGNTSGAGIILGFIPSGTFGAQIQTDAGYALVLNGNFSFNGPSNLSIGTNNQSDGTVTLGIAGGSSSTSRTITVNAGLLTITGPIVDGIANTLIKSGAGSLALTAANLFSGGMVLNAGTLDINGAVAIGSGPFTINGGSIDNNYFNGASITLTENNAQVWNSDFTFVGTNPLNLGTGAVSLGINAGATRTVTVNGTNTLTVGGNISNGTNGTTPTINLTVTGAGSTLDLTGASTYTGATTISGSIILNAASLANIGVASSIGAGNNASTATNAASLVFDGGTLQYNVNNISQTSDRLFTLTTNGGTIDSSGGGNESLVLSNTNAIGFIGSGTRTLTLTGITGGVNLLASALGDGSGGSTSLVKNGSTTWVLTGSNTFSGGTTLNAGTLTINNAYALGTGVFTINGGTLNNSTGATMTLAGISSQTWAGNFNYSNTVILSLGVSPVTLAGNITVAVNSTGNLVVGGAIGDSGSGYNLTFAGGSATNTLNLTGASTYTGATIVNAGTLLLNGTNGSLASTAFTLNGGTFTVDNTSASGGNNNSRLNTSAPITLNGGTFLYKGYDVAGTNSTQTTGTFNGGAGYSTITVTPGTTNTAALTIAALNRTAGESSILVNGGGRSNSTATSNLDRVPLTAAPSMIGTTAALPVGDNAAFQNTMIVPYLVGDATATTQGLGLLGNADTFVTYNASTGLRPLNPTDEFSNNFIVAGNNTYITLATTSSSTASINSLVINAATTVGLTISGTLTDASGALLFANTAGTNPITGGTLAFGANEGITVNSGGTGSIASGITGSGGITKSGPGTLLINGGVSNTGGLFTVDGGVLQLNNTAGNAIGSGGLTVNNGTATLLASNQIDDTAPVIVNSTISATSGIFALGAFSDTVASLTDAGGSVTGAAGVLTTTGNVTLSSGTISALLVTGGNLTMTGGQLSGATTIDGNFTVSGGTVKTGAMTVAGSGTTTITGASTTFSSNLSTASGGLVLGSGMILNQATTLNGNLTFNGATTGAALGAGGGTLGIGASVIFNVARGTGVTDLTVPDPITSTATSGTQTITVQGNGITVFNTIANNGTSGIIGDGASGGHIALTINNGSGGSVALTGASTYSGGTIVASGATLKLGNNSTVTSGTITNGPVGTGTLFLNSGATLDDNAANNVQRSIANSVVFGQNLTFVSSFNTMPNNDNAYPTGSGVLFNNTGVTGGTYTTASNSAWTVNSDVQFTNGVVFNGTLAVSGTGMLILDGTNTFGGNVTVTGNLMLQTTTTNIFSNSGNGFIVNAGGTLQNSNGGGANLFGGSSAPITLNGGTFQLYGLSNAYNNPLTVTANSTLSISEQYGGAGTLGTLTINGTASGGSNPVTLTVNNGNTNTASDQGILTFANTVLYSSLIVNDSSPAGVQDNNSNGDTAMINLGTITESGTSASLTITGTGPQPSSVLVGPNSTYTGNTTVLSGGYLRLFAINGVADTILTVNSGGVFDMNWGTILNANNQKAFNQTIRGLSGNGNVYNSASVAGAQSIAVLTIDGNGQSASTINTFSGLIASANPSQLSLVKSGSSTQVLSGQDVYTGSTTINGGALEAIDGIGLPTNSLLVLNGGVFQSSGYFYRTLGATAQTNQVNFLTSGGFAAQGGTLVVSLNNNSVTPLVWGSTTNFLGTGITLMLGSATADSLVNIENAINLGTSTSNGTVQVTGTATAELSGVISGATPTVNLTLTGGGRLILAGANTYTGQTVIQNGTLVVNSVAVTGGTSNLGNAPGATIVLGGAGTGTLEYTGNTASMTQPFSLSNNGVITVDNAGQTLTASGGVNLGGHILSVSGSGNLTFSGSPITSSNTQSGLTMNGLGTLTLVGVNTYTGPTTINSGIVSVNVLNSGTDSLGVGTNGANAPIINGGTLRYTGVAASTTRTFTIGANGATLDASGSGPISFANSSGYIAFAAGNSTTLTLTGANTGANVFSLILSDPGSGQLSLVKNGTGTWLLTGSNALAASQPNYQSGVTTINAGTLQVDYLDTAGNPQPLGTASSLVLGGSNTVGTLQYIANSISPTNDLDQNVTVGAGGGIINNTSGNTLTISGSLTKANTTLTLTGGAFNVTGQITGGNGSTFNSDLVIGPSASVTLSAANNNYTGPTIVSGSSTLTNGVANALPVGTTLTLGASGGLSTDVNTYDLGGFSQSIAALYSTGSATSLVTNSGGSGTNTLTLSGTNSDGVIVNGTFGGTIKDGASAKTALTVSGGTQTLSGSNSYTGATRVTGGTLIVTGSLSGSSAVTIGNASSLGTSAILAGNGRVGNVTVGAASGNTGAEVEPSDGIAESAGSGTTLTTGSFTIGAASGATLALQVGRTSAGTSLAGDGSDHISTTGGVSLDGNLQLTPQTGYTATLNDVLYLIINGTSTETGAFASVNGFSLAGGNTFTFDNYYWHIDYNATATALTGGYDVAIDAFAPIPEPGTWAMMLSGMGMLIGLQRLRRRRN